MTTATQVPPREAVPQAATWNRESVFATVDDWRAELKSVQAELPRLDAFPGTLSEGAARLADYREIAETLYRRTYTLVFYAQMSVSVDSNDMTAKQLVGQGMNLAGQLQAKTAFATPEMLSIGEETLLNWAESEPRLSHMTQYVKDLFRMQEHVRSQEVEQVLSMLSEPFHGTEQTAGELSNTDLRFERAQDAEGNPTPVNQSVRGLAIHSTDRALRQSVWEKYMDGYLAYKNTFTSNYLTSVKQHAFMTRVRGYESTLERQLDEYNLPTTVFHNLINTYKKHLPTWHRYWDVRRRALGYDSIHTWDIWAPLTEKAPKVSYEKSVDWIATAMQPLGMDYADTLREGCLQQRWVDYAVNEGKRQGAFSYGSYDTYPFIMMSYSDDGLGGLSTLAHELGHSMHSYYTRKTQPYVYANYSMFVAEVASNFNQAMSRAYLFEQFSDDRDFQLALIQEAMDNFHRYFFIMPTLARFEFEVHQRVMEGQPMTADILNDLMADLFAEGYGDTFTDDRTRTGITWATFGHLYEPFYTFQYATGISAAHALANDIQAGKEGAAEAYRQFLAAGSSLYPLDVLKLAGVDMTTPEAVEKTFAVLGELVDRLESLI